MLKMNGPEFLFCIGIGLMVGMMVAMVSMAFCMAVGLL